MAQRRKRNRTRTRNRSYEFRPDANGASFLKTLYLTRLQRRILLMWTLFAAVCIGALVIQDVIMSRVSFFGAATDLVACAILLITVTMGSENGSIFSLVSSLIYFFAGTAPGAYSVAYLPILGIAAALFRENFWRRGFASNVLCAGIALLVYELAVFGTGVFLGLTNFYRIGIFLITGALSCICLLPLYPMIHKISTIGGETWKE